MECDDGRFQCGERTILIHYRYGSILYIYAAQVLSFLNILAGRRVVAFLSVNSKASFLVAIPSRFTDSPLV